MSGTKPFTISKDLVMQAFKLVKANAGAAGVDRQTIADFELNLKGNLYKLWNRLSSGTYFPPPVKAVPIPKKSGGERILGVPTVSDRIAQIADDALAHCETEEEAQKLLSELTNRFKECGLELHPAKTKIVYCKDDNRGGQYPKKEFDFLGYTFRGRLVKKRDGDTFFVSFSPAVSSGALKSMRAKTRQSNLRNRTDMSLNEIAEKYNPVLQGWINYYGCYNRSSLYPMLSHFNKTLVAWAMRKYKKLRGHKTRASQFIKGISERQPTLFAHWKVGMVGSFA